MTLPTNEVAENEKSKAGALLLFCALTAHFLQSRAGKVSTYDPRY